jgi:hypothetical protein
VSRSREATQVAPISAMRFSAVADLRRGCCPTA